MYVAARRRERGQRRRWAFFSSLLGLLAERLVHGRRVLHGLPRLADEPLRGLCVLAVRPHRSGEGLPGPDGRRIILHDLLEQVRLVPERVHVVGLNRQRLIVLAERRGRLAAAPAGRFPGA